MGVCMKDLIIVGTGGVGRETAQIVEEINQVNKEWNILGFVDDNKDLIGKKINRYRVIGNRNYLNNFTEKVYVIIAIANPYV